MQTNAAPHEGLGVAQYAWSTSPLRRYVDLVNQWQLLACVEHGVAAKLVAPFKPKDADLFAVVQGFDETYTAYADHQRRMEYFWCLRWLQQEMRGDSGEPRREFPATVVKDDLVRFEEVPLLMHVPALGVHARGTRLMMEVMSIDELTIEASVRMLRVLDAPVVTSGEQPEEEAGEDEELIEAADDSAQSEAEAQAEADAEADAEANAEGETQEGGEEVQQAEQHADQHATEPRE
jgi:exoribonuclease-2